MEIATLFKDAISSFEQPSIKPLLENEIYNLIQKQIPEGYGELWTEEMAELIAFRFLEPSKNKNRKPGFYFLPLSIIENEDGTINEFPSVSVEFTSSERSSVHNERAFTNSIGASQSLVNTIHCQSYITFCLKVSIHRYGIGIRLPKKAFFT